MSSRAKSPVLGFFSADAGAGLPWSAYSLRAAQLAPTAVVKGSIEFSDLLLLWSDWADVSVARSRGRGKVHVGARPGRTPLCSVDRYYPKE